MANNKNKKENNKSNKNNTRKTNSKKNTTVKKKTTKKSIPKKKNTIAKKVNKDIKKVNQNIKKISKEKKESNKIENEDLEMTLVIDELEDTNISIIPIEEKKEKKTKPKRNKAKKEVTEPQIIPIVEDESYSKEEAPTNYGKLLTKKKLKPNYKTILLIVLIVFLLLVSLVLKKNIPVLNLKKNNITIDYLEKYKEPGYTLLINNKDYTKKVKVSGKVNSKKLGKYIITYKYKGVIPVTKERIVYVKDLTKPAIVLTGSRDTTICPDTDYKEEGYKAIDGYDGDLTKKVKRTDKKDFIIYSVKDSSNNKAEIKRTITKEDKTKPTLTLKDGETVNVYIGNSYKEAGYTATDNCEGDITSKVEINGNVNSEKVGTYEIKYRISDKYGNVEEAIRKVNVIKKASPGTIYLTFDDGPNEGTTNVILDILKEEGVKATFFVTSRGPDYLIKREDDEGHQVALHTYSHDYANIYSSDEAYFNDLNMVSDRVSRITGKKSTIIRFPGGSSNTISRRYSEGIMSRLTKKTLERGYRYYDWNISSGDAGNTTDPNVIYRNVVNNLRDDRINMILMHDIKTYTRDALRNIIRYGKENGYTFAKIDETTEMVTQRVNN